MPSGFSSVQTFFTGDKEGTDKVESIDNNQSNTSTDLITEDIVEGVGVKARAGDQVAVHYVGRFTDGTVFDSSTKGGVPFTFTLGEGMVIEGFEIGVEGMKVGGKRVLVIPPELAYEKEGRGSIPPGTTLIFEIELLEILRSQE